MFFITFNHTRKGDFFMEFKGELKEKIEQAKTLEEAKEVLSDAGIELTDEELEGAAGGIVAGGIVKTYDNH